MPTLMTVKGQVTIPVRVRKALGLHAGDAVDFRVNHDGEVVVNKAQASPKAETSRFQNARGKAQVKWSSDELMALLRDTD